MFRSRHGAPDHGIADARAEPATTEGSNRPVWQGKAQWRSPAFTTRLEDLLLVN
ncbi:DUF4113 domain-containing protein [Hymenobacter sp. BT559]|uniref:DUF4113 domain-containing protein n=1 Tax=Hymenobacter sp. BT559 TaxID=2795729 RepID=UPI00351CA948